ncbi:MAG TPA: AfsR/SARP family transcriptional regulator, partial [Trebonia sp.]
LTAMEDRFEAYLAAGRHVEVMPQLLERAEAYPLRERLRGQLMLALHRAGRSPEALATFRDLRRWLVDEMGVEPGQALQRLHRQILYQDAALVGSLRAVREPAPNHLPADAAGFSGREAQVRDMDRLLTNPTGSPVLVIAGMAGAGKTALAVHWAHRVADRFPGGQLYVNLRGYALGLPMAPLTALTLFLRALGVGPSRVPVDLDEAVGLYRTLLAQRRVLVILDNARSAEQVRPLLPGGGGCVTIVTSRDRLTGLVARDNTQRMELDLLRPDESTALLRHALAGAVGQLSPAAMGALAAACGHLPLALRIAAANIADQPLADVAAYVNALVADEPLGRLTVDGDAHASVRAAFDLAYRPLAPAERRLFRLLGLVPGGDFTVPMAAALAGTQARSAETMLGVLAAAHLVERHPGGRYALHDLLRHYAHGEAELTDGEDERAAAIARLCGFYLDTVDAAARVLYSQTVRIPDPDPAGRSPASPADPVFADPAAARLWLDVELANLVALIHYAARNGPRRAAWLLADWLRGYFWIRRPVAEWL